MTGNRKALVMTAGGGLAAAWAVGLLVPISALVLMVLGGALGAGWLNDKAGHKTRR